MNATEIQQLRTAAQKRHEMRVSESQAEMERDLDAIDRVQKLQSLPGGSVARSSAALPDDGLVRGGLTTLINEAIASLDRQEFTAGHVESRIRHLHSEINGEIDRKAVGGALRRLSASGGLKLIRAGRGRRETIYSKGGNAR